MYIVFNCDLHLHTVDIDECVTSEHNCSGLAQCMNEIGFFRCKCPEGYRLDDTLVSCNGMHGTLGKYTFIYT